jgi:hypothetical protein
MRLVAILTVALSSQLIDASLKKGLLLGKDCTSVHASPFENVPWFYTYSQQPKPSVVTWANDMGAEFVPMIGWKYVNFVNGTRCYLDASKAPTCSVADVAQSLQEGISQMRIRPTFLLGFNEPYNAGLSGGEVADLWRTWIQPAAEIAQLQLVSATATAKGDGLDVLKFFLMRCWDQRNDTEFPCNVSKVHAFAIHEYNCKASVWEDDFKAAGTFRQTLVKALGTYGGQDWKTFVHNRSFWITETNCNWDGDNPGSTEQCKRITGQGPKGYGQGSIVQLNELATVSRYAWWNTYNSDTTNRSKTLNARLVTSDGTLTSVGRAYKNPYADVDCTAATPTPPPTPVMYTCDQASGQCAADPAGTQAPGECIATCK